MRSWSVLVEIGTTSTWLSPLSWVYCCGRTSPTDEGKPWVRSPTRVPFGHPRVTGSEEVETQVANARAALAKENYVILSEGESLTLYWLPWVSRRRDHSTYFPVNALIHAHSPLCKSNLTPEWKYWRVFVHHEPGLWTIKAFDYQTGTSSQSDSQDRLATRPIVQQVRAVHLLRLWLWSLSSLCMTTGRVRAKTWAV